jgi:ubiquinone/menaquinone biosynthesis C-methylase UbiE
MKRAFSLFAAVFGLCFVVLVPITAQEKSVKPGINKSFENPDLKDYLKKFEGESREIAVKAKEIVSACKLKPGMVVADVGAGTGLFTRKFAAEVGDKGKVYAVDISPTFLRHIEKTCADSKIKNVETIPCDQFSTKLPKNSVDLVFICDTYHHFEFPQRTLQSIHDALRPGGKIILIDFHRMEGKSSDFVMGHVRAGQQVFVREITSAGFKVIGEERILKENYFVRFEKKTPLDARAAEMPWIVVSEDKKGFVLQPSGNPFLPWGFNYDHDAKGRLIEDYWEDQWPTVETHYRQMQKLGANVVRIHLQLGKFMDGPETPNKQALDRLEKLLRLAEKERLYLDLTGLGCYHKKDVPAWYDKLSEKERWDVQARFWQAVAGRCKDSPAVFCYDLMNEPVVAGGKREDGDWLAASFAGKHFVQFINLDQKDRPRSDIARRWVRHLTAVIREKDRRHLITVGLVDWSLDRRGLTSGFVPDKMVDDLNFISVHLYPKAGKVKDALETLAGFAVGKPVLIEETFPLACSTKELEEFIDGSKKHAAGWIGFYWGKTPDELRRSRMLSDALTLGWLELFERKAKGLER